MGNLISEPPLVGHMHICDTCFMSDDQVAEALRAYRRAQVTLERRRSELADAIGRAVVEHGVRQVDVSKQTGYTREHVRRICNDYIERKAKAAASRSQPADSAN